MAKVDFVRNDITYSTTLNPDIKFHIVINSYNSADTKGTNNARSFINGIVDNICVASDCLTAANQAQTYHATLRDKSTWITSGNNYSMIEFLAQVCDNLGIANTETTVKDKDKNDITVREIFKKDPDYQVIDYSVFAEGMCVYHETYQLVYSKTTDYPDNNVSLSCITNPAILPNFVDIKNNVISEIGNNRIVRKLVVPDNETSTYTTQQYSYKYTSDWYITSEEVSGIWYTTAGFKLSYGVDIPDNQLFAQKQYTFDNTNFHNADAALKAAYNDSLNDLKDYLDSLSGVKLMTNGFERDSFFDPKTISEDRYDQTPAYSRSRNINELVLSATGTADNYDSSVISLLNFDNGIVQDRAGLPWSVHGVAETTFTHSKFAYGLKLFSKAYLTSDPCVLGWTTDINSAAKPCNFTVDFFVWIEPASASGWLFKWHDIGIKYDSVTGNVVFQYSTTESVNSAETEADYGSAVITGASHHLAIVYRLKEPAAEMYFYVDGVRIGTVENVTIPNSTAPFVVGDPNNAVQVTYDEIKISNGIARWYPKDIQIGKVQGKAGDVWTVREASFVPVASQRPKILPAIENDPAQGELMASTGKFGKGVKFDGKTYIVLETPIMFGGQDFSIDFWIKFNSHQSWRSGVFEIGDSKHSLGFHYYGSGYKGQALTCIHGSLMSAGVHTKYSTDTFLYFMFTYSWSNKTFKAYCNGTLISTKANVVIEENVFQLIIGRFNGEGGPAGYLDGEIEHLRVTIGKVLSPTDAYTEAYDITQEPTVMVNGVKQYQYTKALFDSDALKGTTGAGAADDDTDTSNPFRDFQVPAEKYSNTVGTVDSKVKRDYYIPLNSYLNDNIYTVIPHYPVQKNVFTYQEGVTRTPVFEHYNPSIMTMEGQTSAINPGDYYVTFTPVAGYVWKNGSSQPKRVIWSIKRQSSSGMPEQEAPLVYNGSSQNVNLLGYNPDIMTLSGTTEAIYANDSNNPYYYAVVSLKPGYSWSTGLTAPHTVAWQIIQQPVNKPEISGSSSFVYDGVSKSLSAVYNTNLITVTGNIQTAANATGSGKSKVTGNDLTDEEKYQTVFSLKDKRNYCWRDENDEGEPETDDITHFWIIRRQQIVQPSFSKGSKVYNGLEQGPAILPVKWNTDIYQITGHKAVASGTYTAVVHLVDTSNYEWTDGTIGDVHYHWMITQIEGEVSVIPDSVVLKSTQQYPTPQADIRVFRLGSGPISCSENPAVRTEVNGDIITVYGLKNTYGKKITITVTIGSSGDYTGTTTTFDVQVVRGLDAFSWQEIATMAANNTLSKVTYVGDSKALPAKADTVETNYVPSASLSGELSKRERLVLLAINHNAAVEGSGKATFMFYNKLDDQDIERYMSVKMPNNTFNKNNTTVNGWIGSDIKRRIATLERLFDYANLFPDDLMSAIIPVIKWQDNIGDSVNKTGCVTPTLEYLTVPAEKEVTGTVAYANQAEDLWQQQYRYFVDNPQALQRQTENDGALDTANGIVLRSVAAESLTANKAIVRIDDVGRVTRVNVYQQLSDLVPLITISTKTEDKLWIPDIDTCYEALLHCDNATITDVCSNVYERVDTIDIWSESRHINPILSTDIKKFGNSFFTDGTIDRVISKNTITLGNRDWTIDFWCNIRTAKNNGVLLYLYSSKAQLQIKMTVTGNQTALSCDYLNKQDYYEEPVTLSWISKKSDIITLSVWHHVAVVSKNNKIYFCVDGKVTCSGISAQLPRYQYDIFIGGKANDTATCTNCIFDEIRVLNGTAAFTIPASVITSTEGSVISAFIPPTAAYSDTAYPVKDQRTKAVKITLNNTKTSVSLSVQEHDGPLQVMSSDPSIASAYVNTVTEGSDITESIVIEGHKTGTARIVIWTKDTVHTYGTVRSVDITCTADIAFKTLSVCTPEEIKHIVRTGNALNAWNIGDQTVPIEVTTSNLDGSFVSKSVKATLIGVDHNKDLETNGFPAAHFMLEGLGRTFAVMSESEGWKGSNARNIFCQQIYAALPVAWRNVIVPCTKYTDNNTMSLENSNVISATEDNIWLLSNYEVTGTVAETANDLNPFEYEKQKRYDYFKTAATPSSWLRTFNVMTRSFVKKGTDINFCFVISDYTGAQKLEEYQGNFSVENIINYDSSSHNPIEEGIISYSNKAPLDRQLYTFSGDINKTNAGNYVLKVRPSTGYLWSDGTAVDKEIPWSITAAITKLQISQEDVRLYHKNPTQTLSVTRQTTSALSYQIENPTLVSVTISGNDITLTATGTGMTTIKITSPATDNYDEQQAVVFVRSSTVPAFNTLSPIDIQTAVTLGQAPFAWDIGDCTKDIVISGTVAGQKIEGVYNAFILGFNHNKAIEGNNRLHLCFAKTSDTDKKAIAFGLMSMSLSVTPAAEGWTAEPLREDLQDFLACLPSSWRQVITPCVKNHNTPSTLLDVSTTTDYVWLLSKSEIVQNNSMISKQYQYFATANPTVRYQNTNLNTPIAWYLRSLADSQHYDVISAQGAIASFSPNNPAAVVPCVTVGSTKSFPGISAAPTTLSLTVGSTKFITVTKPSVITISAKSSDITVATVSVSANKINVAGLKTGTTVITVMAQETNLYSVDRIQVPVTVGEIEKTDAVLQLSHTSLNISPDTGTNFTATVTGGTISSVRSSNTTIVIVTKVNNTTYNVLGRIAGQATITVDVTGDNAHNNTVGHITVNVGSTPTVTKIPFDITIDGTSNKIFTYDGTEKDITTKLTGYNSAYVNISGTFKATNHNDSADYTFTLTPAATYEWKEGGTGSKQYSWNIAKAPGVISGITNILLLKDSTMSQTVSYTVIGGSTLFVKSNSNSSLVTTTLSASNVTFTSSCLQDRNVTIVLGTTATLNYAAAELTVTVVVKTADLTVIPVAEPSIATTAYVTYDPAKTYSYSDIISKISGFNTTYHKVSAVTSQITGSVNIRNNDITTVTIKNADIYTISVIPETGYCWNSQNDISRHDLTFKIKRRVLDSLDITVTGPTIETTAFTTSYTPLASEFTYASDRLVFDRASAGTSVGTYKAYFKPAANWCWSDHTYGTREYTWTIVDPGVVSDIPKPVAASYTFTYNGKEHGVNTADIIGFPQNAIDQGKVTVTAQNLLAEQYSDTAITEEFSLVDTTVRYTAVDAGSYKIIFTPADGQKWIDNTTDPVEVTYVIHRKTIDIPVPVNQKFTPTAFNEQGWLTQVKVFTATFEDSLDTDTVLCNLGTPQGTVGTYKTYFAPVKNYKWNETQVEAGEEFSLITVEWKILPGDPFLYLNGVLVTEDFVINDLTTDNNYKDFRVTGRSGYVNTRTAYYDMQDMPELSSDTNSVIRFSAYKSGASNEATITIDPYIDINDVTWFNGGTVTLKYNLEIVSEDMTSHKSVNFIKNFIKYLTWDIDTTQTIEAALNKALARVTNNHFTSFDQVVSILQSNAESMYKSTSGMSEDEKKEYWQSLFSKAKELYDIDFGNTRAVIEEGKATIVIDYNQDNGSLLGSDIDTSQTAILDKDIISQTNPGTLKKYPTTLTQTTNGLSVTYPSKDSLSPEQQKLVRMIYTWWIPNSIQVIEKSTGMSFNNPQVRTGTIYYFINATSDNETGYVPFDYDLHKVRLEFSDELDAATHAATRLLYPLELMTSAQISNLQRYVSPRSTTGHQWAYFAIALNNNTFTTASINSNYEVISRDITGVLQWLDTHFLHEMVHLAMCTSVPIVNIQQSMTKAWFVEGIAELVRGIDISRIVELLSVITRKDIIESVYSMQNYDTSSKWHVYAYSLGYVMFRYLIKHFRAGDFDTPA